MYCGNLSEKISFFAGLWKEGVLLCFVFGETSGKRSNKTMAPRCLVFFEGQFGEPTWVGGPLLGGSVETAWCSNLVIESEWTFGS